MNLLITIAICTTLGVSLIPAVITVRKTERSNRKILRSILAAVMSFNSIWYSVLVIEFIQANLTFNLNIEQAVNILLVTVMYLIRFIYLFSFLKLFQLLFNIKPTKGLKTASKVSGMVVIGIWLLGLSEFLILGSRILTSNLLLYTDILIFFIVIVSCIYLIYQTALVYEPRNQKAIKTLAYIFLIPMSLGFLKWLAGGILNFNSSVGEQLSIPSIVFLINVLMSVWLIRYGNQLNGLKIIQSKISNTNELVEKYKISKREMEVIQLICEGYTNQQIADALFISIETVKDHNSRIFLKTEVKNRTQLAKLFLK